AALQNADLLIQRLVGLHQIVQLLARLEVFLGQLIEALGGTQQIVGELEVEVAFACQQLVRTSPLGLSRLFGDGLFGFGAAALIDKVLQVHALFLRPAYALLAQRALGVAKILQRAVAGQLLAAKLGQRNK